MKVNVLIDASTRSAPHVCSKIEAVRFQGTAQDSNHLGRCSQYVGIFIFRKTANVGRVSVGGYQEVSAVVGIEIHHHEAELAANKNKVAGIVFPFGSLTEETVVLLFPFFVGKCGNVFRSPRREEALHDFLSRRSDLNIGRGKAGCNRANDG